VGISVPPLYPGNIFAKAHCRIFKNGGYTNLQAFEHNLARPEIQARGYSRIRLPGVSCGNAVADAGFIRAILPRANALQEIID
jgi:hypothetical protein